MQNQKGGENSLAFPLHGIVRLFLAQPGFSLEFPQVALGLSWFPGTFAFVGSFFHKTKHLKIIFYDSVGIKTKILILYIKYCL